MMMKNVGYAHLHEHLALGVLPPRCPARVRPVTRLTRFGEELAVPPERSPADDDLLAHVLFALKHEGVDLAILAESLPHLPVDALVASLEASPNGIYLRRLACLYEAFVAPLPLEPAVKGRSVPLFDPKHYVTGPASRNSRWRVGVAATGHAGPRDPVGLFKRDAIFVRDRARITLSRQAAAFHAAAAQGT